MFLISNLETLVSDILIIGTLGLAIAGLLGGLVLLTVPKTSKYTRQKNKDLEDLNEYNKRELRKLRGSLHNSSALPKVAGDISDIEGVISALLPKITDKFPELKGLIGDGDIATVIELAKKNPDIVKKFLPKFLSTGKKNEGAVDSLSV